ncbi:MAG: hypothetical protein ACRDMV_14585 [Streptosporangiales bacterium]
MAVLLAGVRAIAVSAAIVLCVSGVLATAPVLAPATAPIGPGGGPPLALTGFGPRGEHQTATRHPDESKPTRSTKDPEPARDDIVSGLTGNGIPYVALRAYKAAAKNLARTEPTCGLDWALLAAIGRVESNHGRYGGAALLADGRVTAPIYGPTLFRIGDSDGGRLDGDDGHDRAVGPMQFLPGTWASFGADGNDDGRADPQNISDAALAAGRYLCAGGADLVRHPGAAVFRYNHSTEYVALVLSLAESYRSGDAPQLQAAGDISASGGGGQRGDTRGRRHGDGPGAHERTDRHGPDHMRTKAELDPDSGSHDGKGPSGSTDPSGPKGRTEPRNSGNEKPSAGPSKSSSQSPPDEGQLPTDDPTESPTKTPGGSPSDSRTPGDSPTPSKSATKSPPQTPSATSSHSATHSLKPATHTADASPTPSGSPTPTRCASPTPSTSASKNAKPTPTASKKATPTPTPTSCPADQRHHHKGHHGEPKNPE